MEKGDTESLRLGAGGVSIECWAKLDEIALNAALWDNTNRGYSLFLDTSGANKWLTYFGTSFVVEELSLTVAKETVYHVCITSTGTKVVIYINGAPVKTDATFTAGATNSNAGVAFAGNPSGGGAACKTFGQYFAVYNTALAQATVEAHYAAGFQSTTPPPPAPSQVAAIAITRENPPDKLAVRISDRRTGQSIARWAEDEKGCNVLAELKKSGDMPGGHKELTGALPRDPRRDWPDLIPYLDVHLEQPGCENVWDGRFGRPENTDGQRQEVAATAVGHREALEDRQGLIGPGFLNADISAWGDISTQRRVNLLGAGITPNFFSTEIGWQGTGETPPGINFLVERLTSETTEHGELVFKGEGVDLGRVLFNFHGQGEDANYVDRIDLCFDDFTTAAPNEGTNNKAKASVEQGEVSTSGAAGRKFARMIVEYDEPAFSKDGLKIAHRWEYVKVLGNHGLPLQGTWPKVGYTAKQMLQYAVPLYSYLEATAESIEDDGFIIPHAWFAEPGTMATVVKELTKYGLYDWFVLNGKLFEMRKPGTYGRTWYAYTGPSELKETGEDGTRLWRNIVVRWQDVDGSTKTVGFPGSGATYESSRLEITDPDHPAVRANIPREDILDLQGIAEAEFAIEVGERWLKEANELSHSGSATLRGYALDSKGIYRPVAQVMPGDEIIFPDAGSSAGEPRKIVQVDYSHSDRSCQVTLDAPKESTTALLERFRAELKSRAQL